MNTIEKRAAASLSFVFAFRMLGLFMVLPVMATLGAELQGATPLLIGFAVGAYGLSQALLQIPFGYLSDRFGRKPMILAGLLLFALGSIVAGLSDSIWGVIVGRFIQGCGAIASAIMALASDLTRDQERSKVMAIIGSSIGAAFLVAITLGPLLASHWQLSGLFFVTGVLAVAAMLVVVFVTPNARVKSNDRNFKLAQLPNIMREPQLLRLDFSIFSLHLLLTAFFVVIPSLFASHDFTSGEQSLSYVMIMLVSFAIMIPVLIVTEKQRKHRTTLLFSIAVLIISCVVLAIGSHSLPWFLTAITLFFIAFNILEASLPSLVSRIVPLAYKGSALGVYSTSQFLGAFSGGILAGFVMDWYAVPGIFVACAALCVVWAVLSMGLNNPPQLLNLTVAIRPKSVGDDELLSHLKQIKGIKETVLIEEENIVYVKAFKSQISVEELRRLPFVLTVS